MTPAGRKLVRFWTGAKAYKAAPAGALREWHWRALARAYVAGDEGLGGSYGDYANIGWNTRRRLRDYKLGPLAVRGRGALVEEIDARGQPGLGIGPYQLRMTANGRALYEREWLPRALPRRRGPAPIRHHLTQRLVRGNRSEFFEGLGKTAAAARKAAVLLNASGPIMQPLLLRSQGG